MALGLFYRCSCGERFKIYLPKGKVYDDVVNRVVDWCAVDAREQADGDVDEVQRLAESTGCRFVDGRKITLLACPRCTKEINLVSHFRSRLLAV
jgi:hypothetical protein